MILVGYIYCNDDKKGYKRNYLCIIYNYMFLLEPDYYNAICDKCFTIATNKIITDKSGLTNPA